MKRTTLCYIKKEHDWLLLYRNKKSHDPNAGKWIGIGGRIEPGETPDECNRREVLEETGIALDAAHFHGVIQFRSDSCEDEDMYLYSAELGPDQGESGADAAGGNADSAGGANAATEVVESAGGTVPAAGADDLPDCDEGELAWIPQEKIFDLPMWEGDRLFLEQIIEGRGSISMTLRYEGDKLVT